MGNKKAFAIDIGGTKIYTAIINEEGKIEGEVKKTKTPKTLVEIEETLKNLIRENEDKSDVIAIATAGAVNRENNKVIGSTGNLPKGYKNINFEMLSKHPVFIENDANSAAWAEYMVGSAKGYDNNITVTLGTGVGGGIITDGRLLKGKSGAAGEMHFKMSTLKKRKCSCGVWDCWEIYASGKGLELTAYEMLNKEMTSYEIIEKVKNEDKDVIEVLKKWEDYITMGLIGLADIFDPDCIVLSGSMAEFTDVKTIQDNVNKEIVTTPLKILKASAGNYSGMIGVALLALSKRT